ncbi:MAG: hypothetical protein OXC99_12555 [Chloroflexi bacterium]|nr:hypothetical protein [Chloroflexota bacterium]
MEIQGGIAQHCGRFYDEIVFDGVEIGQIVAKPTVLLDVIKKQLIDKNPQMESIPQESLHHELTALRLELYGLAWQKRFKKDEQVIQQSAFTVQYLKARHKLSVWETMGEYNRTISQSTGLDANGRTDERAKAMGNVRRMEFFEKWAPKLISDPSNLTDDEKLLGQCIARSANRLNADLYEKNELLLRGLFTKTSRRLNIEDNIGQEAATALYYSINMLSESAEQNVKSLRL